MSEPTRGLTAFPEARNLFVVLPSFLLLKLCKQKGLKADKGATKPDLPVGLRAFEEMQRSQPTSREDDVDDIEEEGVQTEDEERDDPGQGPKLPGEPNSTPADD
ncbi:hypothetical protein NDU88_006475 [Pleurodeles waltl]|uniref:Uncharacterized protein n=1 Tax=Pleurodeles waltl TaxID=8319 RepID=A0AAV7WAQ8_PLEWA|nr:hypothetical protein NDU88_006475 [Pleurodeles waltl]